MPISGAHLAAALVVRLAPVVPPPFHVRVADTDFLVEHPTGWGFRMLLGVLVDDDAIRPEFDDSWAEGLYAPAAPREEPSEAGAVANAVSGVLNSLQDAVSEATKEPWPLVAPLRMAAYGTRVDGDVVHLWYGDREESPVIAFAPIPLADLRVSA